MTELNAESVFERLARDLPPDTASQIVVVGSLAAAYAFRHQLSGGVFTTKDADLVLRPPRIEAVTVAARIANDLLQDGWTHRQTFGPAQLHPSPKQALSVIRLSPPGTDDYFVEFLTVPGSESDIAVEAEPAARRDFGPVELNDGYWALAQFDFLMFTIWQPMTAMNGIAYARPSMLALANLLGHPTIGFQR